MAVVTARDTEVQQYGPWLGAMRAVTADQVPPEFIAAIKDFTAANNYNDTDSSNNFLFIPRIGSWKLRGGSSVKFDTFGALVGLLPDKWEDDPHSSSLGSRIRHAEEFLSESISDGTPTEIALFTRETVPSTLLDDGRFSNVYIRDQVNSLNYTIGNEFTQTYAAVGTTQTYRIIPLWYDSGDGGLTRGIDEYKRRFFFNGSRRFLKVGNWWHFPSVLGTPSRWRGRFAHSSVAGSFTTLQASSDITTYGTQMLVSPTATSITCTTNGTTAVTSAAAFGPVTVGMNISGSGIPSHTFVTVKTDASNITISNAATNSTSASRQFQSAVWQALQTSGDSIWVDAQASNGSRTYYVGANATISNNTAYTLTYRARYNGTAPGSTGVYLFALISSDKTRTATANIQSNTLTASFATYTVNITTGPSSPNGALTANTIELGESNSAPGGEGYDVEIDYLTITTGDADQADNANYLFPTGPFPPTHAGTIAAGNLAVGANTTNLLTDADDADGSWTASTGSDLFEMLNDTVGTPNDSDYIIAGGTTHASVRLSDPGFTPNSSTHRVTMWNRVKRNVALTGLSVDLWEGSNASPVQEVTTGNVPFATAFTTSFANYSYELSAAEIDIVTDWTNLYFRYDSNSAVAGSFHISASWLEITPIGESTGGWKGHDRFLKAVAYRYEDGSIWAGSTPRFPNTTLSSGLDLVTVDSANPNATYDKVTWSNIPVPPKGVTHVQLWRTPKIDSTVDANLQLNPFDMRFIDEVPAGITTYDDYKGDDESLALDAEKYFIRYDHIMQPRTRYMSGGDMRVIAQYGGTNPCAITIAPIGRLADYDLNTADNVAATYGSGTGDASYMRVALSTTSVVTVTLARDDGASLTTRTFTSDASGDVGNLTTIQALVDAINDTSIADTPNCGQWRAQLCPGVDGTAALTALCPHHRQISATTATSTALTATSGLSKVAVGARVTGTNVAAGSYVVAIVSDTELTLSAATTGNGTNTMSFFFDLGDTPSGSPSGYQRVIANSLPGFLYFTKTYLDTQTFDKSATWMTVASPGSVKAAPNCWSGKLANRFTPPLGAGFVQGGGAVDHGFVVLYGNKVGAIRPRGPDSFTDQEYGLVIIDESRGCCAWNTITPGNRFVPFLSTEGVFAADLENVKLLSEQIYVDQPVAVGDFYYEAPKCVAATAMDVDVYISDLTVGAYAWARIVRGVLFVGYRSGNSGGTTHCDRMVRLDFTTGDEATGLPALYRRPGLVWGWSTPLLGSGSGTTAIYRYALISDGRRSDGLHIYGWNEENAGTTGDGRVDEIETGTTDPGSAAITGRIEMPWLRPPDGELMSFQEAVIEHSSPVSSTGSLVFHRTFSDETYTMTPGTSALPLFSEMKLLPFNSARANCNAGYWDYRQATGSARELRRLVVKFRRIHRYKS